MKVTSEDLFTILIASFTMIIGIFVGTQMEERRVFRNCLDIQAEVIYKSAIAECENLVK